MSPVAAGTLEALPSLCFAGHGTRRFAWAAVGHGQDAGEDPLRSLGGQRHEVRVMDGRAPWALFLQ